MEESYATGEKPLPLRLLVAVGSRSDRVCSIGAFARAEASALRAVFKFVDMVEPDARDRYPVVSGVSAPDVIFFHAPSLHDRKRPWNAILSAMKLRSTYPRAVFVSVVHEFSEAPAHWKLRQRALLKISNAAIVNSAADYEGVRGAVPRLLRSTLGPTLFFPELLVESGAEKLRARRLAARQAVLLDPFLQEACAGGQSELRDGERWVLHPGLVTPGKGADKLWRLASALGPRDRLIVMGSRGPKEKDREFARAALASMRARFGERVAFLESPPDAFFAEMLLASELVVLAYDAGLSERRSSFLSAASCGANVWTTVGKFSADMGLEESGAHTVPVLDWASGSADVTAFLAAALSENEAEQLERRAKNLKWAQGRCWKKRAADIRGFVSRELRPGRSKRASQDGPRAKQEDQKSDS